MSFVKKNIPSSFVINKFNLEENQVEGGYLVSKYPIAESIQKDSSAIYYFLDYKSPKSYLHMVSTDIIYHFYSGEPIQMLLLYPEGFSRKSELITFGNDIEQGQAPMKVIPGGTWMGSYIDKELCESTWSLMGVTMTPPFNPNDYHLGDRKMLLEHFPEFEDIIVKLTKI